MKARITLLTPGVDDLERSVAFFELLGGGMESSVAKPRLSAAGALMFAALALPALAGPCDSEAHRAFDFWLGEWQVRTPEGKLAGVNRIERGYEGCVLHERYASVRDYRGESLNIYDASRKLWHQTWVDTAGTLLLLEGGVREGRMFLEGQTLGKDGQVTRHRITWTPNADGSVRQFWESAEDTADWKITFDGRYTRK